jgi:hypothetical protein
MKILILIISLLLTPFSCEGTKSTQRCDYLVHIGDSTTLSMMGTIKTDYEATGFSQVVVNASNGRSIIFSGDSAPMNGIETVRHYQEALGDNICWVVALGTNDSSATSPEGMLDRFNKMMFVIGGQKVLWINVWSDSPTRPTYSAKNSNIWNSMLIKQKVKYSNMYIFDWATIAKSNPTWFYGDGIHYNGTGSLKRSWWISRAAGLILIR